MSLREPFRLQFIFKVSKHTQAKAPLITEPILKQFKKLTHQKKPTQISMSTNLCRQIVLL